MTGQVISFDDAARAAQKRLEVDMVVEVCRRIAEAFSDVADLGGVTVDELRALVARAEADVLREAVGHD